MVPKSTFGEKAGGAKINIWEKQVVPKSKFGEKPVVPKSKFGEKPVVPKFEEKAGESRWCQNQNLRKKQVVPT